MVLAIHETIGRKWPVWRWWLTRVAAASVIFAGIWWAVSRDMRSTLFAAAILGYRASILHQGISSHGIMDRALESVIEKQWIGVVNLIQALTFRAGDHAWSGKIILS